MFPEGTTPLVFLVFSCFSLLSLFTLWITIHGSCQPGPDGRFATVQLGSPSNVTAPYGSDVQFICCGGHKWTYEADDGYASREIGPHPEAAGAPDKRPGGVLLLSTEKTGSVQTTVYTMHDDKGRLILFINNANSKDTGHYRCHGDEVSVDAFLAVSSEPLITDGNQSVVVQKGAVIQRQVMFPSDQLNKVSDTDNKLLVLFTNINKLTPKRTNVSITSG